MSEFLDHGLMLRFRDLVTEPGGNIAEHRRLLRKHGYVWWGWWKREHEIVPIPLFRRSNPSHEKPLPVFLFDTDSLKMFSTTCTALVVSPNRLGLSSPDYDATPGYYVRGRYPVWFRLEKDILPSDYSTYKTISRPTQPDGKCQTWDQRDIRTTLTGLRDERATLWLLEGHQDHAQL